MLVLVGWIVFDSPSFKTCVHEAQQHSSEDASKNNVSAFLSFVNVRKDCVGEFVENKGEAVLATFTVILAISTILLWLATRDLFEAGEEQLKLARDIFVADNRPWLQILEMKFLHPLKIDDNGINIYLQCSVKNTGNSPALNAVLHPVGYINCLDPLEKQVLQEASEVTREHGIWGSAVFQGETTLLEMGIIISKADLQVHLDKMDLFLANNPTIKSSDERKMIASPDIQITGCVSYQKPFGPPKLHHSWFVYNVSTRFMNARGDCVPLDELSLLVDERGWRAD
jgi:hypothetical protein